MRFVRPLICLLLVLTIGATAQTPAPKNEGTAVIKSSTQLVLVPVLVRDKSGKPVQGLKAEDFAIKEEGKPQTVSVFEEVTGARQTVAERPAYEFSNESSVAGQKVRLVVLDAVNSDLISQERARVAMLKMAMDSTTAKVPVSLMVFRPNGVQVLYPFTQDPKNLATVLNALQSRTGRSDVKAMPDLPVIPDQTMGRAELRALVDFMREPDAAFARIEVARRIESTLQNFRLVADSVAGIPVAKELIWVTAGFPYEFPNPSDRLERDFLERYRKCFDSLAAANISVYPVDARGLLVEIFPDITECNSCSGETKAAIRASGATLGPAGVDRFAPTNTSLRTFAEMTGGKAFVNRSDIDKAIKEIDNETQSYYMLGYYVPGREKTEWRKLKVELPGREVRVRHRSGYLSGSDRRSQNEEARMQIMLQSGLDMTALPVVVRLGNTQKGNPASTVEFEVAVPSSASLSEDLNLSFIGAAMTENGETAGRFSQLYKTHLSAEQLAVLRQYGMAHRQTLSLPAGKYRLVVMVKDNNTDRVGTLRVPIGVE